MFSERVPRELDPNQLTQAVDALRAAGRPIVDLTLSNPTRAGFEYPADLLAPLADCRALVYEPRPFGAIEARRAVARDYERQGLTVSPERIVLTASTSEAYSIIFKLLADAGDEILVPRPSYPLFDHLARLDLVSVRSYELEYDGAWSIDFASVERALTSRTRAVLVVSPNNPTGSFIRKDELDRLADLCGSRNAAIVADEVFSDYELEPGASGSAGRVAMREDILTFALGGLSKSVGLPQVKLGWIAAAGPERVLAPALERLELICDTYLSVSTPAQVAAGALLDRGAAVREQIAARVVANYRALQSAAIASSCTVLRGEGGWNAVVQVPSLEPEEDLVLRLLTTDGVLTHPGYFFDFPRESFLVVSLLPPEAIFAGGIARILRHFDCSGEAPAATPSAERTASASGGGAPRENE
jgi:aspartate/methionine/tyrosine aminotransferase